MKLRKGLGFGLSRVLRGFFKRLHQGFHKNSRSRFGVWAISGPLKGSLRVSYRGSAPRIRSFVVWAFGRSFEGFCHGSFEVVLQGILNGLVFGV